MRCVASRVRRVCPICSSSYTFALPPSGLWVWLRICVVVVVVLCQRLCWFFVSCFRVVWWSSSCHRLFGRCAVVGENSSSSIGRGCEIRRCPSAPFEAFCVRARGAPRLSLHLSISSSSAGCSLTPFVRSLTCGFSSSPRPLGARPLRTEIQLARGPTGSPPAQGDHPGGNLINFW